MVTEFAAGAVPAWASKFGPAEKEKIRKFVENLQRLDRRAAKATHTMVAGQD